jgi:hypothetical protein
MTDRAGWLPRALGVGATAALVATGLAACGDDDTQTIAITLSEKNGEAVIQTPGSAETGVAEIEFTNNTKEPSDGMQLLRVEGDHSAAEVIDEAERAFSGKQFPDWLFAGGGTGPTDQGQTQTVTQVLEPGTYFAFTAEGEPDPKSVPTIAVTGEPSDDELPEVDATVSAIDYGFEVEGLKAGENEILFENTGAQPHHLIAAPIDPGKTIEDVRKAKDQPPIDESGEISTAILEGGESQVVTLPLDSGNYALVCFITDRQGGPPHVEKGMLVGTVVK